MCDTRASNTVMPKSTKRKKIAIAFAFTLLFVSSIQSSMPFVGTEIFRKVYNPKHGRGYGAPGHKRKKHQRRKIVDVWNILQKFGDKNFESLTRMYLDEFKILLEELSYLRNEETISSIGTKFSFENKILCIFIWVVKYCDYSVLSFLFGSSNAIISTLITTILPYIAGHFAQFIPNRIESELTSSLSSSIIAVIDSTIHARTKSARHQHQDYSKHYERHGMMTTLLVDFRGSICSLVTNGKAILHDSMASFFMRSMVLSLGSKFALADTGYAKVPYVICGFSTNQLNTESRKEFDRISREEQKVVEHVNNFIKKCKVLSKTIQFIHSRDVHVCCVFLVCGWYNWMKEKFDKFNYV